MTKIETINPFDCHLGCLLGLVVAEQVTCPFTDDEVAPAGEPLDGERIYHMVRVGIDRIKVYID